MYYVFYQSDIHNTLHKTFDNQEDMLSFFRTVLDDGNQRLAGYVNDQDHKIKLYEKGLLPNPGKTLEETCMIIREQIEGAYALCLEEAERKERRETEGMEKKNK